MYDEIEFSVNVSTRTEQWTKKTFRNFGTQTLAVKIKCQIKAATMNSACQVDIGNY